MCRMLITVGHINNKETMNLILQGIIDMALERTGENHEILEKKPDFQHDSGWGSAWVTEDENISMIKSVEPIFEDKEKLFSLTEHLMFKRWFMIHARKASPGYEIKVENVHPFVVDFEGMPVAFAHNGEVKKEYLEKIPEFQRFIPLGNTDSEKFFLHILETIKTPENLTKENIQQILSKLNENEYSGLNFFLATPKKVFVNVQHSVRHKYFTMKKTQYKGVTIISSEKFTLPGANWEEIPNNTLLEFSIQT